MLPERAPLPGDDEIEAALVDYHALFGGDAHVAQLRAQREEALRWMQRLAQFEPALVGGVAAGWATAHSDIQLDLVAANAKSVELALAQCRRRLSHDERRRRRPAAHPHRHARGQRAPVGAHARGGAAAAPPGPARRQHRARCRVDELAALLGASAVAP